MQLGADDFISTGEEGFEKKYFDSLDFILSAADAAALPLDKLLTNLKVEGKLTSVGLPDHPWESLQPQVMAGNGTSIGSSHIGSKVEAYEMLKLAAEKGVKPIIDQILPMSQAGKAIQAVHDNKVRYRFVLKADLE